MVIGGSWKEDHRLEVIVSREIEGCQCWLEVMEGERERIDGRGRE